MVPADRPIIVGLATRPRWANRGEARDPTSNWVGRAAKSSLCATVHPKGPRVEDNAASGEPASLKLLLGDFDVAGTGVQATEQHRQRIREEFADFLGILSGEDSGIPSIQASDGRDGVTSVAGFKRSATHHGLQDSLTSWHKPAERLSQDKQVGKTRKLAEERLAKKVEELARSNAELEQFAYVASHDLQEPLRMVANYTQLLAERYSGKLDGQADKYIRYAVDGALRMQALIQDLLAFSRAGGPTNGLKRTDCKRVVEQVLSNLQVAIHHSGAVVTSGNLPVVMARAVQVEQVFQNLIGNAIKFTGTEPPVIHIGAQRRKTEWLFSVTDNGINIPPEDAEAIFGIFHRLHSRSEYAGNGIGLAICKKIVEQNGGRIWLEPQTTPGATFQFTWPAVAPEESV